MGQLANEMKNRPQGTLPSDTQNPRKDRKEHCKAVTLRSGKVLDELKIRFETMEKSNDSIIENLERMKTPEAIGD